MPGRPPAAGVTAGAWAIPAADPGSGVGRPASERCSSYFSPDHRRRGGLGSGAAATRPAASCTSLSAWELDEISAVP